MRNFPASWVAPDQANILPGKIKHLLEKFGSLREDPHIERTDTGIVATASFKDAAAATAAASTLHGVDNRMASEKKAAGGGPATEAQRFHVVKVPEPAEWPSAPEEPQVGAAIGAARTTPTSCRLQMSSVPVEWSAQDIQGLCGQYGAVDSVFPDDPGGFIVTFGTPEAADTAAQQLSGMQLQSADRTTSTLQCVLLPEEDEEGMGAEEDAAVTDHSMEAQWEAGQARDHVDASMEAQGAHAEEGDIENGDLTAYLQEGGGPIVFYVDELQLATGDPGPGDTEIFLRDLPLEDYTETQLREWLDDFGAVNDVIFLRDPITKELSGRGYVRFASHEEAAGLLAAFPQTGEDDGNVKL